MSFFFGGGSKTKPEYTGLATQTSTSDVPITILMGLNRCSPNIIWQGDFQTHAQKQGGKGGSVTTYTYSASFQLALCWGTISDVTKMWKNEEQSAGYPNFTLFKGEPNQAPWGYLSSVHPDQALGYPNIAHLDVANYDMGSSNTIDQHSFEIEGLLFNTQVGGAGDADPAQCISLYINSTLFGVVGGQQNNITLENFLSTDDATGEGDASFQTFCRAIGFGLSPVMTSQEQATTTLQRWMDLTNTAIVWTGYSLKFIPYTTDTLTGNGVTYKPDATVVYSLTQKDYIQDDDGKPVKLNRIDPKDAYNSTTITINDRSNEYNSLPVEWRDQTLVNDFGLNTASSIDASEVCDAGMAALMVMLLGQRNAYNRNSYEFKVGVSYCRIEPMDILEVTDAVYGTFLCRVTNVEEDDDDQYTITADEFSASVTSPTGTTSSVSVSGNNMNTGVDPGPVNTPLIFEPPTSITGGFAQVWAAVSGGDGTTYNRYWGGCYVWISTDGAAYNQIGSMEQASRMGKLTAALPTYSGDNPDTGHTMAVSTLMSNAELSSASSADDAKAGSTMLYVSGEYLSYEDASLSAANAYNLTNLYRGQGGVAASGHAAGDAFARLDSYVFKYDLPAAYIGKQLYLKFQSYNVYGKATQDLSTCEAYTFTPNGTSYGTGVGGAPAQPAGLTYTPTTIGGTIDWDDNSPNDNVTAYTTYRAVGHDKTFADATRIGSSNQSIFVDASGKEDTDYTYFVVATNAVGDSTPSAGLNATTSAAGTGVQPWTTSAVGTGASQAITLPYADLGVTSVFVFVNGLKYSGYTISGDQLTITTNANGDSIEIVGITQ